MIRFLTLIVVDRVFGGKFKKKMILKIGISQTLTVRTIKKFQFTRSIAI